MPPEVAHRATRRDHARVQSSVVSSASAPRARARAFTALAALIIGYAAGLSTGLPSLAWAAGASVCAAAALALTWYPRSPHDRGPARAESPSRRLGPDSITLHHHRHQAPSRSVAPNTLLVLAWTMLAAAWCVFRAVDAGGSGESNFARAIDPLGDPLRVMVEGQDGPMVERLAHGIAEVVRAAAQ